MDNLASRLSDLGHEVWMDQQLSGGQDWWDQVLRHIREADALVLALSPASLRSHACAAEWAYAASTSRPLLPVMIRRITLEALPQEIARLQIVDYGVPSEVSAIQLARAVDYLSPGPEGDWSSVEVPPVPFSYLSGIARELAAQTLSQDEQLNLVSRLETALRSPDTDERTSAQDLLRILGERNDLFAEAWHRVQRLLPRDDEPRPDHAAMTDAEVGDTESSRTKRGVLAVVAVVVLLAAMAGGGAVLLFTDGDTAATPNAGIRSSTSGSPDERTTSPAPSPTRTRTPRPEGNEPRDIIDLPAGLFCRDLLARDYSYVAAVNYWQYHGNPNQMDEDRNGIPCETVYPASDVDAYWMGRDAPTEPVDGGLPTGLYCHHLRDRGLSYADAVAYWRSEGSPDRMDADLNGIPCETVYPTADVDAFW